MALLRSAQFACSSIKAEFLESGNMLNLLRYQWERGCENVLPRAASWCQSGYVGVGSWYEFWRWLFWQVQKSAWKQSRDWQWSGNRVNWSMSIDWSRLCNDFDILDRHNMELTASGKVMCCSQCFITRSVFISWLSFKKWAFGLTMRYRSGRFCDLHKYRASLDSQWWCW